MVTVWLDSGTLAVLSRDSRCPRGCRGLQGGGAGSPVSAGEAEASGRCCVTSAKPLPVSEPRGVGWGWHSAVACSAWPPHWATFGSFPGLSHVPWARPSPHGQRHNSQVAWVPGGAGAWLQALVATRALLCPHLCVPLSISLGALSSVLGDPPGLGPAARAPLGSVPCAPPRLTDAPLGTGSGAWGSGSGAAAVWAPGQSGLEVGAALVACGDPSWLSPLRAPRLGLGGLRRGPERALQVEAMAEPRPWGTEELARCRSRAEGAGEAGRGRAQGRACELPGDLGFGPARAGWGAGPVSTFQGSPGLSREQVPGG